MNKRKGGISVIRVALIAGVVGLLLIGAGVFSVFSDQNSKRSPLDIAPYPNAQLWGTSDAKSNARNVFYRSTDKPDAIAAYYQQKMVEHYGNSDQNCVRLPPTGNTPGSDTKNSMIIPYQFICLFDNSGFQSSQYTRVVIYPGLPNDDPFLNAAGMTIVKYEGAVAALNPEEADAAQSASPSAQLVTPPARRSISLLTLVLLVLALLLAIYVGTNVLSVLYGVIAPPAPPLPPGMDQVSHTSAAYGVDHWYYTSAGDPCDLTKYIVANGGVCNIAPLQCGEYRETQGDFPVDNAVVARCSGKMDFSIFNEQWWGLVMRLANGKNQLEISREVYWLGTGPQ